MSTTRKITVTALAAAIGVSTLAACGGESEDSSSGGTKSKTVTLVSHDSFAASDAVLKEFTRQTGYTVKVLKSGDAGAALNKEILTKGSPQGDVFFGVDNTLLSRALDNGLFTPYEAKGLGQVRGRGAARQGQAPCHAGRHRRHLRQLRQEVLRGQEAGAAAVVRRPDQARVQEPARDRERGDVLARPRLPARQRREVRRRRLAGLLEEAQGQRREGRRRLGAGVQRGVLRLGRRQEGQGGPAARRLVRLQPAGRGAVREAAAEGGARRVSPRVPASVRSSSPDCSTARRTRRAARRCWTSWSPGSSRRTCR